MAEENNKHTPATPTPLMGLVMLVCITAAVVVYILIAGKLGIVPLYAGFIFALYFGSFKHAALSELPAALIGCLGGIVLGSGLHFLPVLWGAPGLYIELGVIGLSVYLLTMGWLTILVNPGFMLMLTIATVPSIQGDARFVGMGGAVLLVAAMMAGATLAANWITARKTHQAGATLGQPVLGSE